MLNDKEATNGNDTFHTYVLKYISESNLPMHDLVVTHEAYSLQVLELNHAGPSWPSCVRYLRVDINVDATYIRHQRGQFLLESVRMTGAVSRKPPLGEVLQVLG
jgi:hypothetical protein